MMKKSLFLVLCFLCFISSKAAIVYTDIVPDSVISFTSFSFSTFDRIPLDINNDGVNDFAFRIDNFASSAYFIHITSLGTQTNYHYVYKTGLGFPSDAVGFPAGTMVQQTPTITGSWGQAGANAPFEPLVDGFLNLGDKYVGIYLSVNSNIYYGWIRVNVAGTYPNISLTVKDYAYQNTANTPIAAGDVGSSLPLPVTVTTSATAITTTGATLTGTVNANNTTASNTFEYGLTTAYGSTVNATPATSTGNTATAISATLSGLLPGTTYHYRAISANANGTSYGSDSVFTTLTAPVPLVTTGAAGSVTNSGATLTGTVNANNTTTVNTFEYGLTTAYGSTANATPATATGNTTTSMSATLSGLLPGTTYHYRAVSANANGTAYGSDMSFTTTLQPSPAATTGNATAVTGTTAVLNAMVNANGAATLVSFEYGPTTSYGSVANAAPYPVSGNTLTNVAASISGLQPGITYHYRIKAVNSGGTTYGGDMSFSTLSTNVATLPDEGFSLTPNPAGDQIVLHNPSGKKVEVHIMDMLGKTVCSYTFREGVTHTAMDVSQWMTGNYIVILTDTDHAPQVLRLTIAH